MLLLTVLCYSCDYNNIMSSYSFSTDPNKIQKKRNIHKHNTPSRAFVRTVRVNTRQTAFGANVGRLLQLRVRTLVHVHARFPSVVQLQSVGTRAERWSRGVDALVRTPGRPVPTLVHVVTSVPVVGQPGARYAVTRTLVPAPGVGARSLARPVPVA